MNASDTASSTCVGQLMVLSFGPPVVLLFMVRSLLIIVFIACCHVACATHLLGGEIYYDKLAGDQYRITLKLYRDCGPGNANGTGFDGEAIIVVYDGNGVQQAIQWPPFVVEHAVPVELSDPCLLAPPAICVRWSEYTTVVGLAPNATGYIISYQRCCRTPGITNLPTWLEQGLTCTVRIPPAAFGANSSPRFSAYPPIAMCIGQDMAFDHSATDPDGDELVYDLVTPYAGGTAFAPSPTAAPPPYQNIVWGPGFSGTSPMTGSPGLAIDPATGEMTVHPTLLGSYAVAVRVREYRNGQLLSEVIRDLRLDVVACTASIVSVIAEQRQDDHCAGLTVTMRNESINGQFWHWDFGVPGTDADTSDLRTPVWTYADTGTYVVTLIANPGFHCADTSVSHFSIHYPLDPIFTRPAIDCVDAQLHVAAEGRFTPNATVTWDFGDGAAPQMVSGVAASTAYSAPGTYPVSLTVREFGCEASYVDSATVHPRITMEAMTDTAGCVHTEFVFAAEAEAWTPITYHWDLGDGTTASTAELSHVYTEAGQYDVSVTAATSSGCVDARALLMPTQVAVFPLPVAEFTVHPMEVSLLDPVVKVTDHARMAEQWEYMVAGHVVDTPSFTYTFEDAGWYEITQTVVSGANCTASTARTVYVSDHLFYAPTAFTPDGDGWNDVFLPSVKGARLYELVIFDRWGVERFRTTDPKAGWSGDDLPQGIYTFKARLSEYGPMNKEYVGHFSLLR